MPHTAAKCTICGHRPFGAAVSYNGELTCTRHPVVARCQLCTRPTDSLDATWTDLGCSRLRCPTCGRHGVDTSAEANRHLPKVRQAIDRLGFALRRRVKVRLVDANELALIVTEAGRDVFGATSVAVHGGGRREPLDIVVLRGLTPAWFGRTIVHENVHAWLAEQGIRAREQRVEEGMCEMVAREWLSAGRTPMAQALVRGIEAARDPVYGDGFRLVRAAIDTHGLAAVLDSLRASGDLPRS